MRTGSLSNCGIAMIERCLQTELEEHLGYPKHGRKGEEQSNARNGKNTKKLKSEHGELEIAVPRDREGSGSTSLGQKAADTAGRLSARKSWRSMRAA